MDERTTGHWASYWQGIPLFAFVEEREELYDPESGKHVGISWLFDIVSKRDISSLLADPDGKREELASLPTAQVGIKRFELSKGSEEHLSEGTWHSMSIGPRERHDAVLFRDLGSDEEESVKASTSALEEREQKSLSKLVSLVDAPSATSQDLKSLLKNHLSRVIVAKVGQGNCNALCRSDGVPELYFDLGAGCLWNASTRPSPLEFCFTNNPPVVLSHWDWDHWYGAEKCTYPTETLQWIAPDQQIGTRTRKFASKLLQNKNLLLWPPGIDEVHSCNAIFVKCSGSSKNDSGIATFLDVAGGALLCPADSAFDSLPIPFQIRGNTLAGMVAPHHGSKNMGTPIPRPTPNGRLAFSFGAGNRYGHPGNSPSTYSGEGWSNQYHTPSGSVVLGGPRRSMPCGRSHCTIDPQQP